MKLHYRQTALLTPASSPLYPTPPHKRLVVTTDKQIPTNGFIYTKGGSRYFAPRAEDVETIPFLK